MVVEGFVSETFFGSIDPPGMVVDVLHMDVRMPWAQDAQERPAATGVYLCAVPKTFVARALPVPQLIER